MAKSKLDISNLWKIGEKEAKFAQDYMRAFAKAYVAKATEKLVERTEMELDRFYNDYDPIYYERTGNLRNNSYKPYSRVYAKKSHKGSSFSETYVGGVEISPEFMDDYMHKVHDKSDPLPQGHWVTSPDAKYGVIEDSFMHGSHGNPDIIKDINNIRAIKITRPSPYEGLLEYFMSDELDRVCGEAALRSANNIGGW